MNIGEHGQSNHGADFRKDRKRLFQPDAALGGAAGAVGLVKRGLVDEADLQPRGDLLQGAGDFQRMCATLELARARDDRNRQIIAEFDRSDVNDRRGLALALNGVSFVSGATMPGRSRGINL